MLRGKLRKIGEVLQTLLIHHLRIAAGRGPRDDNEGRLRRDVRRNAGNRVFDMANAIFGRGRLRRQTIRKE